MPKAEKIKTLKYTFLDDYPIEDGGVYFVGFEDSHEVVKAVYDKDLGWDYVGDKVESWEVGVSTELDHDPDYIVEVSEL